jgi:hypothetical protein
MIEPRFGYRPELWDNYPETGFEEISGNVLERDFWPASQSAIRSFRAAALVSARVRSRCGRA